MTHTSQHGISVIEILVVVSIVGIAIFSLYELVVITRTTSSDSARRLQALAYAQEGIEAVRNMRDRSWDDNISPLSESAAYYLSLQASAWTLTTTNPGAIDSLFTRIVKVSPVNRDTNGNIADTGTEDEDTRKITVTVSWTERSRQRNLELETYLTNFLQ